MNHVLAIALGGAIGSVLRFWVSSAVAAIAGRDFPVGTLCVNIFGSLVMGVLFVLFLDRQDSVLRAGLIVGVLGGFTTFSAFSIETFSLIEQGAWLRAGTYAALSVILCVGAAWLGVLLARQW